MSDDESNANNSKSNKSDNKNINVQSTDQEIHPIQIRLPQFWPNSVNTWFIQVEAQFSISRITNDLSKYNYLISALPLDVAESITDILENPPDADLYSNLKKILISRHSLSIERRIKRIISDEEMGDSKPSDFYRKLKSLAGTSGTIGDDLIKKLWFARLPHLVNVALIPLTDKSIDSILEAADKIWEAVQSSSEKISVVDKTSQQCSSSNSANSRLSKIEKELSEIKDMFNKFNFRSRSQSRNRDRSSSRDRSNSRSRKYNANYTGNNRLCYYHFKFGNRAKKCAPNCIKNGNQSQVSNSSNASSN